MDVFPEETIPNNVKEELAQYAANVQFYKNKLLNIREYSVHSNEENSRIELMIARLDRMIVHLLVSDETASGLTNEAIVSIVSLADVVVEDAKNLIYALGIK